MRSRFEIKVIASKAKRSLALLIASIATLTLGYIVPTQAAALTDAQIIAIYIQVNGFDIETALLGRSLAGSQAVKQLAAHVSSDHVGVRQTVFSLAEACKVKPSLPDERNAAALDHSTVMKRLVALNGAEFDKAYLQHEVAYHRGAIDAVRTVLLPATTCPALKAHFTSVLPAFEHHLAETQKLAAEIQGR